MAAGTPSMRWLLLQNKPTAQCLLHTRIRTFSSAATSYGPRKRMAHRLKQPVIDTSTEAEVAPQTPQSIEPLVTEHAEIASAYARPTVRLKERFQMKTYKPRTPGLRHLRRSVNDHLWKGGPFKPLTFARKGQGIGGRNHTGRITVRHRGNGHKRRIRTVDFERFEPGAHKVERIERDPGRSGHIALVTNEATGKKSYILASDGLRAGDVVQSYRSGVPRALLDSMGGVVDPGMLAAKTAWRGNCLPLHMIPVGAVIHAIGTVKGGKAKLCRSAGTYGTVIAKEEESKDNSEAAAEKRKKVYRSKAEETKAIAKMMVIVRLQSGEIRRFPRDAPATVGIVSNPTWHHEQLGKAGRSRWLGIRPTVRGLAMNACDHPHGGGRGKSKGNVHPVSPWGRPAKSGYKTRKVRRPNRFVVTERPRNFGKRRKE